MSLNLHAVERRFAAFSLGPVSLSIEDEILSVLGPSGAGKTTLLSTIAGLQSATAGDVRLDGRVLTGRPPEDRGTAMVFQDGALFPHLSVRDNIGYAATDPDRIDAVATTFAIGDILDRAADTLSAGERQRVALARALAADPDALLLDEPLANLDAPVRERLRSDVRSLLSALGVPVVHVTHDQRAAAAIGDRIAVMHDGSIDHVGPPSSVFTRPATEFVATFTGSTVLDATVERIDGDSTVVWAGYPIAAAADRPSGTRVSVAVRPDRLQLGDGDPDGARVQGRIQERLFEGDRHRVTVHVPGGATSLEVTVPPSGAPIPEVGTRVTVTIPETAVHVLANPSQGLNTRGHTGTS